MKNILLFFISMFLVGSVAFAQSLSLTHHDQDVQNGDVIVILQEPDPVNMFEITTELVVHNNNMDMDLVVKVKCNEMEVPAGVFHQFCWAGSCYAPGTALSGRADTIKSGMSSSVDEGFSGHSWVDANLQGTVKVFYTFFDVNNENDSISVYIHYISGYTGVDNSIDPNSIMSEAYPNPTTDMARFNYSVSNRDVSAELIVSNLLGSKVLERAVEDVSGTISIDVSSFTKGLYFATLVIDNKALVTRKFAVR